MRGFVRAEEVFAKDAFACFPLSAEKWLKSSVRGRRGRTPKKGSGERGKNLRPPPPLLVLLPSARWQFPRVHAPLVSTTAAVAALHSPFCDSAGGKSRPSSCLPNQTIRSVEGVVISVYRPVLSLPLSFSP
jgi:hypothetical protein